MSSQDIRWTEPAKFNRMCLIIAHALLVALCWTTPVLNKAEAAEFAPPTETQARDGLQKAIREAMQKDRRIRVSIALTGKAEWMNLVKCDDNRIFFGLNGSEIDVAWNKLTPEQWVAASSACASAQPAGGTLLLMVADYYLAINESQKADETIYKALEKDPALRAEAALRWDWLKKNKKETNDKSSAKAAGSAASPVPPATGTLSRAAILNELTDFSLAGRDRRLGPDYGFYHKDQTEKFPEIFMPPGKEGIKGRQYQRGGPWSKEAGDYSSTQGQILYVADRGFSVDRVTVLEMSNNCFSEKPEPPWHGGFRPEPASKSWLQASGGNPGMPVFMARGMGGWSNSGVIVFSSGLVGVAGTCTAKGSEPTLLLPRNKIPTAISVTNKNEFALITVCDVETMKGQVAVIALESSAKKTGFAHEWPEDHPGLANVAVFTRMKLLGFVDLPGIAAPTGICAVGDSMLTRLNGPDGNQGMLRQFDLSKASGRESFGNGNNAHFCSRCGFAIAISKHEGKAAFIDLQPLFQKVHDMYFTSDENYRKTLDAGPEPGQWPYTFEVDPSWKPVVVKVLDHPQPTAVLASMDGGKNARAFIASQDGRIGMYQVGGLATEEPALPQEISCVGLVQAGRNPVCLAYQKHSNDTFMAVSRGDREISWVRFSPKGNSVEIVRRLRDSRLLDPVQVDAADTHGIETTLITVADFRGRKIVNYRLSELNFATNGGAKFGMGADGKAEFECGGALEFPGSPFCISATNVN